MILASLIGWERVVNFIKNITGTAYRSLDEADTARVYSGHHHITYVHRFTDEHREIVRRNRERDMAEKQSPPTSQEK